MASTDLTRVLEQRPIPIELVYREILRSATRARGEDLEEMVSVAWLSDTFDQLVAWPAICALPAWGEAGVAELKRLLTGGPHWGVALSVMILCARGRSPSSREISLLRDLWDQECRIRVDEHTQRSAQKALRELLLLQVSDADVRHRILSAMTMLELTAGDPTTGEENIEYLLRLLVDARLVINGPLLTAFADLLDATTAREQKIHEFLARHPVLLDPLAVEVRSKEELGSEFVTDFVVRRSTDQYVLVEIEKATDRLFTQSGDFTAVVTHAVGQVRDFQAWVSENIAYAQKKLPGIRHPHGLLVIGRSAELNNSTSRRLDEENFSRRGHIRIMTYDDLLDRATTVYGNMLEAPPVL